MSEQLTITEAIKEFNYETPAAMAAYHSGMVRQTIEKYTSCSDQVIKVTAFNTRYVFDGSFESACDWVKGIIKRMYPETAHLFWMEQNGFKRYGHQTQNVINRPGRPRAKL